MTSVAIVTESDSGVPFDVSARAQRDAEIAALEESISKLQAKVVKCASDLTNAQEAVVNAQTELASKLSPEGVAAFEAIVAIGLAWENRTPEQKAADEVAAARAALDAALAAEAQIKEG